jgi:hypothetical protein
MAGMDHNPYKSPVGDMPARKKAIRPTLVMVAAWSVCMGAMMFGVLSGSAYLDDRPILTTANVLPGVIFGVLTFLCYLRVRQKQRE